MSRFVPPIVAPPAAVRMPPIRRTTLDNGLQVWTARSGTLPVIAGSLILDVGTADDPPDAAGLTSLMVDLLDEGAGGRDAIAFAEAAAALGATIDVHAGADATTVQVWSIRRHLEDVLALVADAVIRPHLAAPDLERVRDLRLSRLQQLRRTPAALADRALTAALFAGHGYARPGLGTTRGLEALTLEAVAARHAACIRPDRATLVLVGEAGHDALVAGAAAAFGDWRPAAPAAPLTRVAMAATPPARTIFVARDGAPQSEIRCAHLAPARRIGEYPALLVVNAALGGSFSGRLNQRLRQQLGYTYGARSAFDLDRDGGSFTCETSVQADKTAESVRELHQLVAGVRGARPLTADELAFARDALTLGYARHFETPRQVAGALGQLAVYGLDDDEYDAFVPRVRAVTSDDAARVAATYLRPDELITVVVGDPAVAATLGDIETVQPEF